MGYTHPLSSKWFVEAATGVWFFGDNDEFLGETRKQNPVGAEERLNSGPKPTTSRVFDCLFLNRIGSNHKSDLFVQLIRASLVLEYGSTKTKILYVLGSTCASSY